MQLKSTWINAMPIVNDCIIYCRWEVYYTWRGREIVFIFWTAICIPSRSFRFCAKIKTQLIPNPFVIFLVQVQRESLMAANEIASVRVSREIYKNQLTIRNQSSTIRSKMANNYTLNFNFFFCVVAMPCYAARFVWDVTIAHFIIVFYLNHRHFCAIHCQRFSHSILWQVFPVASFHLKCWFFAVFATSVECTLLQQWQQYAQLACAAPFATFTLKVICSICCICGRGQ